MVALRLIIGVGIILAGVMACAQKATEKTYYDKANLYMKQEDWVKAEDAFSKLYQSFPNGVLSSQALFMTAYINANHLNNYEKARSVYGDFLKRYPDHSLSDDAKYELENLGKSVDELPFILSDGEGSEGKKKKEK